MSWAGVIYPKGCHMKSDKTPDSKGSADPLKEQLRQGRKHLKEMQLTLGILLLTILLVDLLLI